MRNRTALPLMWLLAATPNIGASQSTATLDQLKQTMALRPDPRNGELLYAQNCSGCHRRGGWGSGPRAIPTLAGQQEIYLLEQLLKFSNMERDKPEMHDVVTRPALASTQALRDVTAYIANQPRDPSPERGDGTHEGAGARLYAQSCAICHGSNGEGDSDDVIPAIGGQQYHYLVVRMRAFASHQTAVERGQMQPAVVDLLSHLSPQDVKAVADYASRLPALQAR